MKTYELLAIIKPNLDMDEVEKAIGWLEENIGKLEGTIVNIDKMGRKKLAFEVQNYRDGFFFVVTFQVAGDKIATLKNSLKLNDNYLRYSLLDEAKVKVTK